MNTDGVEMAEPRESLYGDWMVHRDSYQDHTGEYRTADSWTATKSIGGPWSRSRPLITTIRLRIHGFRRDGRLRPSRWWASVQFGAGYETPFVFPFAEANGRCVSLADAVRQAEASKELADMVRRVTLDTYARRENQSAIFQIVSREPEIWNDPVPDGPPVIEPWGVVFRPIFGSLDGDLPYGNWVAFSWRRSYKPVAHWAKVVTIYRVRGTCASSSCSPAEHARFEPLFPDWFPQPDYS